MNQFLVIFLAFALVCLAVLLLVLGNRPSRNREIGDLRGGLASTKSRGYAGCSNPVAMLGYASLAEMAAWPNADDADGSSSLFQPLRAALRRSWAWFLLGAAVGAVPVAALLILAS